MVIRYRVGVLLGILALTGCTSDEMARFWDNPFNTSADFDISKAPPADAKVATRVHAIGSQVLAANKLDIEVTPMFSTVGLKEPMIFHQPDGIIVVSEGLVNRCATDAELAAVLSHQLAELVNTHDDRVKRHQDRDQPLSPRLTPDVAGTGFSPDMTRAAEEGYRQRQRPTRPAVEARTDASVLAKSYLQKAGFDAADYTRVEGVLREAEKNAADRSFMRSR